MKNIFIYLFICLNAAVAQSNLSIDQIEIRLEEAWRERIKGENNKAELIALECLGMSQNIKYTKGEATANNYLGLISRGKGDLANSLDYFREAYDLRKKSGHDLSAANVQRNIGAVFRLQGKYDEAVEMVLNALATHQEHEDTIGIQGDYLELFNIYENANEVKKGIDYLNKNLDLHQQSFQQDTLGMANVMYSLALSHLTLDSFELAEKYGLNAAKMYKEQQQIEKSLETKGLLADIYTQRQDYRKAEKYYTEIIQESQGVSELRHITLPSIYLNYSHFLIKTKKEKEALINLTIAEKHLGKKGEYLDVEESIAFNKANAFAQLGMLDSALHFQYMASEIQSQLFTEQRAQGMSKSEVVYKTNEIKSELNLTTQDLVRKKQQNLHLLRILAFAIIGLLITFILWQKQKKDAIIQSQKQRIHFEEVEKFIRNEELQNRTVLIEGQDAERERIAMDLHEGVGGSLMALNMNLKTASQKLVPEKTTEALLNSIQIVDSAYHDIREISHSLRSGTLAKFGIKMALESLFNKLDESPDLTAKAYFHGFEEEDIAPKTKNHLYRIAQELVSNTLKHANATEITLQLNNFEHEIALVYQDNGRGFDKSQVAHGLGLRNIEDRVHALGGTISLDTKQGAGVTYFINIPHALNQ